MSNNDDIDLDFSEFETPAPRPCNEVRDDRYRVYAERVIQHGNYEHAALEAGINGGIKSRSKRAKQILAERRRYYIEQLHIDTPQILSELAAIAFADIRNLFDADGNPLPINQIDDDTAAALVGVEVQQMGKAEGWSEVKKYKLADKLKALQMLGNNLGLFTEKQNITIDGTLALEAISSTEKARRIAFLLTEGARNHTRQPPDEEIVN